MADLNLVYNQIEYEKWAFEQKRKQPTRIRLFTGDWNLWHEIEGEYSHRFKFLRNDAGDATVTLPIDHPVAQDVMQPARWPTKSLYLVFDRDGARWSGRVEAVNTHTTAAGEQYVELSAIHDYQKLKQLLVWANPFLPAEVQFPKSWVVFGPARWAVGVTLLANLHRKENASWMLPDDPLDFLQWFRLNMKDWGSAVKFQALHEDSTPPAVVESRFKYFHDCVAPILQDAQLVIDCRRYLEGDPHPLNGQDIRHGCLVYDIVDKSDWKHGTAYSYLPFGDMISSTVTGFVQAKRRIEGDGMAEGFDVITVPNQPDEYKTPGWFGTEASAPWVVLEHGPDTGVETFDYEYIPPGPIQFVTGGSSMAGVNELIKAAVVGLGGILGSMMGQSQLGSVVDALAEPLYSDVFAAFMAHKMVTRGQHHGWDAPYEMWVDGSEKAYSLSALSLLRKAKEETAEKHACHVKMTDGAPYFVGPAGHGDFFIGDRVGVHALGMEDNKLFVNAVESLEYTSTEDDEGWDIEVGPVELAKGFTALAGMFEKLQETVRSLGVW